MGLVDLLFSFHGRVNRLQYWLGSLGVGLVSVLAFALIVVIAGPQPGMSKEAALQAGPLVFLLFGAIGIVSGWSGLSLQVKRFHDRNQPGWLCLLPLLPMFGLVSAVIGAAASGQMPAQVVASAQPYVLALWAINLFFFINLGCLAGTDGHNKYGQPPGSPSAPQTDPAPRTHAPAQTPFSLGSAEAAIERAIADKARQAPAPSNQATRQLHAPPRPPRRPRRPSAAVPRADAFR